VIDVRLIVAIIAISLILVGVAVFRRQTRATSCPRHNRLAGRITVVERRYVRWSRAVLLEKAESGIADG
jgi:uncharacterized membrane protein